MATLRGRSRKLEFLSLQQRMEVIHLSEQGLSQRSLAQRFKCGKTQIQNTLANKERFMAEWQGNAISRHYKRRREQPNRPVNESVLRWFQWAKDGSQVVTGPMLQEKAREYAAQLGVTGFTASNGWLENFRKRHGIWFGKKEAAGDDDKGD